jgi:hypothetical protein
MLAMSGKVRPSQALMSSHAAFFITWRFATGTAPSCCQLKEALTKPVSPQEAAATWIPTSPSDCSVSGFSQNYCFEAGPTVLGLTGVCPILITAQPADIAQPHKEQVCWVRSFPSSKCCHSRSSPPLPNAGHPGKARRPLFPCRLRPGGTTHAHCPADRHRAVPNLLAHG